MLYSSIHHELMNVNLEHEEFEMPNATICFECQKPLAEDPHPQLSRCESCFQKIRHRIGKIQSLEGLVVHTEYHPGYFFDMTSWKTSFFADGKVEQEINWYESVHGKDRPRTMSRNISPEEVEAIRQSIAAIDLDGLLKATKTIYSIDGGAHSIYAPDFEFYDCVDVIYSARRDLSSRALAGYEAFEATLKLLDSLSPYDSLTHSKNRRVLQEARRHKDP